jgi:hypothetical protein
VEPPNLPVSLTPILSAFDIDLPRFNLFEQYSAAAYDEKIFSYGASPDDEIKVKLFCAAHNCPLVESADTSLYFSFDNPDPVNVAGFLAVDRTNRVIVLSFRGTDSSSNRLEDIRVWHTDWSDVCNGCLAHYGFSTAWENITDDAVNAILAAVLDYPFYSLVITGHSYGAAVATLAAADLRHGGYSCALVTSPQQKSYPTEPILTIPTKHSTTTARLQPATTLSRNTFLRSKAATTVSRTSTIRSRGCHHRN